MANYVGIDLGTTNSVICTFDGKETKIWKSPEMNDVTPSAIYVDKRGNRFYGRRAYDMAPINENNSAVLFKRYLGTNQIFHVRDKDMTPEECSAEIIKVLYGYLPEHIAADPETATVITVPAAFNQMKKDATLAAAQLAGIGRVTLMQEPVAAVMSIIKSDPGEKTFVIYDLGGGTFDVSIAESIGGRVNLLAQGGKEMCGGRDWDRMIFRQIALPWLMNHFHLPKGFDTDPKYRNLVRLTTYACEQAKIELSSMDETDIRMDEMRLNMLDMDGEEIYLDIPLSREQLNALIRDMITDTVEVTQRTIRNIGLTTDHIAQIVFIGGPTKYAPLRTLVSEMLGIPQGVETDPMTAVAEGASIFAESIDWSDDKHHRKNVRQEIATGQELKLRYEKRTPGNAARIALMNEKAQAVWAEIISMDTGWTSGRMEIESQKIVSVPLTMAGENRFRLEVWDLQGRKISLKEDEICIDRTIANIGSIPASHPIAVKVLDTVGGKAVPVYLVEENDTLPKQGQVTFYAGRVLHAGSRQSLTFTLWEGGIQDPIEDNRYIGTYQIKGTDLVEGTIPMHAEIICEYEMSDSGALYLGVSIPCLGLNLTNKNFYSRQEGQTILDDAPKMLRQIRMLEHRAYEMRLKLPEIKELSQISRKLRDLKQLVEESGDPEILQQANNEMLEYMRAMAKMRKQYRKVFRRGELEKAISGLNKIGIEPDPSEKSTLAMLQANAEEVIQEDSDDFDIILGEINSLINQIRWRSDAVIQNYFSAIIQIPSLFTDQAMFDQLRAKGLMCLEKNNFGELRSVVIQLNSIMKNTEQETVSDEHMYDDVNVLRN